jgi:hypothetical protein
MNSLMKLEPYFKQFGDFGFYKFLDNYRLAHGETQNKLHENLEFSLKLEKGKSLNLRYGIFKINSSQIIYELLEKIKLPDLSILERYVPEFALGRDILTESEREKIYLLRLPDIREFKENPSAMSLKLAKHFGFSGKLPRDLYNCYLIGIDFPKKGEQSFKFYTRTKDYSYKYIRKVFQDYGVNSNFLENFQKNLPTNKLIDLTISKKIKKNARVLEEISIFLELGEGMNEEVENCIKYSFPNQFEEYKNTLSKLEENFLIRYSQIGIVKPLNGGNEKITVYFSPKEK